MAGFLFQRSVDATVALVGQQIDFSETVPGVSIAGGVQVNLSGVQFLLNQGTPSVTADSSANPWDPPSADTTISIVTHSQANFVTALAAEAAYHATHPTAVVRINFPSGTPSANLTSNLNVSVAGPTYIDQKLCTWVQNGAHSVSFLGNDASPGAMLWKKPCTVGLSVATGFTTAAPTSGSWPTTPVAGDVGRLVSKHRYYGNDSYSQSYMGELMEVLSYDAGTKTITFTEFAWRQDANAAVGGAPYTAADNPHFCLMDRSAQLWVRDFKMTGLATQATILLRLDTLYKPYFITPFLDTCANNFIYAIGNYGGGVIDPHIEDGVFSGSELTYGMNTQANKHFNVIGTTSDIHITRTRNPVDGNISNIGAGLDPVSASLSTIAHWGPDIDTVVDGLNIEDMKSNGTSTHSGSVRRIWKNITWTRTGMVSMPATAPMIGAPRGKGITFINFTGIHSSGVQLYAYDADPSAPGAAAPRDGSYRDASDFSLMSSTYEINGGAGSNGWIFTAPNAGATLDGEVVKYSKFDNLLFNGSTVTLSGAHARAFLPLCGSATFANETILLKAVLDGPLFTFTRPLATLNGDDTVGTFLNWTLDLDDYPAASGNITVVSAAPSSGINVRVGGTITVINKPSLVHVIKSGSGASGLTIVGG